MKTIRFILLFWTSLSQGFAQPGSASATIDTGQIKALINNHGSLFWNTSQGTAAFEFPKDSGTHAGFAGALWLGGIDTGGNLHLAAQTYNQAGFDYQIGPVSNQRTAAYLNRYNRVWRINKTEIQQHIQNFTSPGYQPPADILSWPGNGDTANGESNLLAPFIDVNLNGHYEPLLGDYPNIRGDQAAFFIYNDATTNHGESGGTPLGAEVHVMAYAYDAPPPVGQTIFVSYKIINRGTFTFPTLFASMWQDVDLGSYSDDVVGCDVGKGLFFTYNFSDIDAPGPGSYGAHPPASGCMPIGTAPYALMVYNNSSAVIGNPSNAQQFYNLMRALWKDGSPLTQGGNGYNTGAPTRYAYPWNTNPADTTNWAMNLPGDWRMVTTADPFFWAPEQSKCITFAFPVARAGSTAVASANLLKQYAGELRQQFDANASTCSGGFSTGIRTTDSSCMLRIWPNPTAAHTSTRIHTPGAGTLCVFNTLGQMLWSKEITQSNTEMAGTLPGAYLITWNNELGQKASAIWVIQPE